MQIRHHIRIARDKWTALMLAAKKGHVSVVSTLLDARASPELGNMVWFLPPFALDLDCIDIGIESNFCVRACAGCMSWS